MRLAKFQSRFAGDAERVALRCGATERSFGELERRSNQLAQALRRRGHGEGDRLAIACRNGCEFVEAVLAAERAGLRATAILATLTPRELAAALECCDPHAIVTNVPQVAEVARDFSSISTGLLRGGSAPGFEDYERALSGESGDPVGARSPGVFMSLSSGTTGRSKAVYREHSYIPPYLRPLLAAMAFDPRHDLAFVPCPLQGTGVYSLGVSLPLKSGVRVIIGDFPNLFSIDAEEVLRTIARERVTHLYLPLFGMRRLLALPPELRRCYDLGSLRSVLHGGSACPPPLKRAIIDWLGPILTEYYAGAEGGGTVITAAEWLAHEGSVGKPAPDLVRILADDLTPAPPGAVGRIYFHAPKAQRFAYFRDPEATRQAYRGDYFTLGDLGRLDGDGYLYITGRASEAINVGGYNVAPAEIDEVLLEHPAVGQCAALAIPDEGRGEAVGAAIALRDGYSASPALSEALMAWCRARLIAYKCPAAIVYIGEVPGFAAGKAQRSSLRALFEAAHRETADPTRTTLSPANQARR